MLQTPSSNRFHIGIFGKTNSGKSSLINKITNQNISIISDVSGTTTDPVYKAMELLPIGPVMFVDTAGFDDLTELGEQRVLKTKSVLDKVDVGIIIIPMDKMKENYDISLEKKWIDEIRKRDKQIVILLSKCDLYNENEVANLIEKLKTDLTLDITPMSFFRDEDIENLKKILIDKSKNKVTEELLVGDRLKKGDIVVLVAPQDIQAPKGRLILPQVQTIRNILDFGGIPVTVTLDNLDRIMEELKGKIALVITDSQIFSIVEKKINKEIPLTSFSIIMARAKGELETLYNGAKHLKNLKKGDRILIAEACTHHKMKGDIAREKLPLLLQNYIGEVVIDNCSGQNFPDNFFDYSLIIHCGSCMLTRNETINRIRKCSDKSIKISNFGMIFAEINGILDRVVEIFDLKK